MFFDYEGTESIESERNALLEGIQFTADPTPEYINGTLLSLCTRAFAQAKHSIRKTNIILGGKTGVGKSTLVNAVFGRELSKTGVGRPVTQTVSKYEEEGFPITLTDTRGFEEDPTSKREFVNAVTAANASPDAEAHFHQAWMCIRGGDKRLEPYEEDLVKQLSQMMPVIIVVLQFPPEGERDEPSDAAFVNYLENFSRTSGVPLCYVTALEKKYWPAYGLEALVQLAASHFKSGHRRAFARAQQIDERLKIVECETIITRYSRMAAVAGAVSLPFSDAIVLIPIEVTMIGSMCRIFGVDLSTAVLTSLVGSLAATVVGTTSASVIKLVLPGIGTIFGAAIEATIAYGCCKSTGELALQRLKALYTANNLTTEAFVDGLRSDLQRR